MKKKVFVPESTKQDILRRYTAGEKATDLTEEFGLRAPSVIYGWHFAAKRKAKKMKSPKKKKTHVFTDLEVAPEPTEMRQIPHEGKYMIIICDLSALKHLAANL